MFHLLKFLFSTFFLLTWTPKASFRDFQQLNFCKDSPAFQKRLNTSLRKIENRLKLYTPETKESLSLQKEIISTKNRFERYGNSKLLCSKEGLPRIIASGQWDHANEFIIPSFLFLYITGWIGWVGRNYLGRASATENPFESEIILNLPIALSVIKSGDFWPIDVWKAFTNKTLIALDDEITVSPR